MKLKERKKDKTLWSKIEKVKKFSVNMPKNMLVNVLVEATIKNHESAKKILELENKIRELSLKVSN